MNVTMDKTSAVSGRLTVKVEEADYKDKVAKELKEFGRSRVIPGFRKGHVPTAELYRRFGQQMTSDVINREVYDAVINYIRENKLNILGEPLPVEVKALDLKNEKDFTFEYDVALAPELDITLDKKVKLPYYTIDVTDEMINEQDDMMRKRFGSQVPGEEFEDDAIVKGTLMQLDDAGNVLETEGAVQVISAIVLPMRFADKAQFEAFKGAKVGDKVVFNPAKAAGDDLTELASMLNVDKDRAAEIKSDFQLAISEIIVVRKAELGEEYYNNVFGKDKVHDEDEYRAAIKSMIAGQLAGNSEALFQRDATDYLMKKYGDMELPVEILKKWLVNRNEDLSAENIDAEFEKMEKGLKWQMIKDRLAEITQVKIEEGDMLNYAKYIARQQFAQYGMTGVDDETLTDYAKHLLADKNYVRNIYDRVSEVRLFDAVKEKVTVEAKVVSLDEFKKIAEA